MWLKKNKKQTEKRVLDEGDEIPVNTDNEPDPASHMETGSNGSIEKKIYFKRLRKGLSKTRTILTTDIDKLFSGRKNIDDEMLEDLEELLITSDIGVSTTMDFIERISQQSSKISDAESLKNILKDEIFSFLCAEAPKPVKIESRPHVIMVLGVNGTGKTTTIGKLAAKFRNEGKKVIMAASDTFRAAAIEQLTIWADRSGAEVIKHKHGSDPAAVAYDAMEAASARDADIVLVDTAGRLHTKINLMEELKKIKRSISKVIPHAPHEILLVLDATTGQNALSQADLFNEAMGITGLVLTKLDGTAKGGMVVGVYNQLKIPLRYIGVGEQLEDLQDFDPKGFVDALF